MRKDVFSILIIFVVIVIYFSFINNSLHIYELLSLALFLGIFFKLVLDLGSFLSIRNLIAILLVLQWVTAPILGYYYDDLITPSYQMVVSKEVYYGYVLPATLAHLFGLYIPLSRKRNVQSFELNISNFHNGIIFIILGFSFDLIPGLGFLGYLLSNLKYVGAFYMIFSKNKFKIIWVTLVFSYLGYESISSGMFHELILWSGFLIMLYFSYFKKSLAFRFLTIFLGFLTIMLIQMVKPEYRSLSWNNNANINKFELFSNIVSNKVLGDERWFSEENIANNTARINEGWIISNVMAHVPEKQPFVYGETVKESIIASIFPRFILPNKAGSGGVENMRKYAGITLVGTSMDISQVGEAYANFGVTGGIIMMFCIGFFFNLMINFIEKRYKKYPELVFWMPLIFLQVVKAETSLVTILNHFVKASIITWFFFSPYYHRILDYFIKRRTQRYFIQK